MFANIKTILYGPEANIKQHQIGLLYEDGVFMKQLKPGKYRHDKGLVQNKQRDITIVDTRQQSLTIKNQEILTKDKVALRVSLLVYYKIVNPESAIHNVSSFSDRIYEDVQLSARRFLASRTLEDILSDRNEISDAVREDVKVAAEEYGVDILRADVKDLVFAGNLREIMNQVLETERQAEAQIIKAKRDAEMLQIETEARANKVVADAKAGAKKRELELNSELENAKAYTDNPALLELRKLKVLENMAMGGGHFYLGLDEVQLSSVLKSKK